MQRVKDYENQTTTQTDANTQVNYSEFVYPVDSTWEHTPPTPDDQNVWPQTPTTPQNVFTFVPKPVMPGTPEMSYPTGIFLLVIVTNKGRLFVT